MHQKKLLFVLILTGFALVTNAQFKRGTRMVGANIASAVFNFGTSDISYPGVTAGYDAKTTSFSVNISPSLGWFISDHTAIGVTAAINPTHRKGTYSSNGNTFQEDVANSFSFGLGGFARNYFGSSSSFMPFGQFSLNLGMTTAKTNGFFYGGTAPNDYKSTYTGKSSGGFFSNATAIFGMTKLVTPHTGLDIFVGYTFSYDKNTYKTTKLRDDGNNGSIDLTEISEPTTKNTTHGVVLGLGFQIFLDPRK